MSFIGFPLDIQVPSIIGPNLNDSPWPYIRSKMKGAVHKLCNSTKGGRG